MGSSASARADVVEEEEPDASRRLAEWGVSRVAESLACDTDLAALAPYVQANAIDGASVASMDEAKLERILREVGDGAAVMPRALLERIHAVAAKDDEMCLIVAADEEGDEEEYVHPPLRAVRDNSAGSIFWKGVERGALVVVSGEMAEMQSSLTEESTGDYNDGEVIYFAGQPVGTIIKRLGQGAMGTVYEFELSETRKRCALKSVRGDLDAKTRTELEKGLTSEVGIVFAAGRSTQVAGVIQVIAPLSGIETNAKGVLLCCDLVEGGDLEEVVHSGKRKFGRLVKDYKGELYSDAGAKMWPLGNILLQILKGFHHLYDRGILHQASGSTPRA